MDTNHLLVMFRNQRDAFQEVLRVLEATGSEEDVDPGDVTLFRVQLPVLAVLDELVQDLLPRLELDVLGGQSQSLGQLFLQRGCSFRRLRSVGHNDRSDFVARFDTFRSFPRRRWTRR